MKRKRVLTTAAREELTALIRFVAASDPEAARKVRHRISSVLQSLSEGGLEGRKVRLRTGEQVHRWPVLSWVIYYQIEDKQLVVLRLHSSRQAPIEAEPDEE